MQQIALIALAAIIFTLILQEICYSVRVMKYHQFLAQKRNIPFDNYCLQFELETKKHLRELNYQADMDSKYNA